MLAEPGQFDMVVSIGDCGGSLVGGKGFFSKGFIRVSVPGWEGADDCHSRPCEVDGAVVGVGVGVGDVVLTVELIDDACDLYGRRFPVL